MRNAFMDAERAKQCVLAGEFDHKLHMFYGVSGDALQPYRERIVNAIDRFTEQYGARPIRVFSVSGRSELGGNHTDHQHGNVLAAGISLDIIAVAAPIEEAMICVQSEGYPEDRIALSDLSVHPEETGSSASLLRGVAARFQALGKPVSGFAAYTTSDVLKGSGLSSSAAFEVMLGMICNDFFADSCFSLAELAKIAQYAENEYFGKPCGLMDQMACALGGVCAIDFTDPEQPVWRQISLDLAQEGYALCIIGSGAGHADLTDQYAAVPAEMCAVAEQFGAKVLRDVPEQRFWSELASVRRHCGDRAVMRAVHFYGDSSRVLRQADALEQGRFSDYLAMVKASGQSSVFGLQNIYAAGSTGQQAVAVALALCDKLLDGEGAYRVHGGGFAGTVQAYVPVDQVSAFRSGIDAVLGDGACHVLQIRACGAAALWDERKGADECC